MSLPTFSEVSHRLDAIKFLFQSQADKHKFFRLTIEESKHVGHAMLFGKGVSDAFPSESSRFEIEESGNCFALGRYTACVFHLMRALEKGLKALADDLEVDFPPQMPIEYEVWQTIIERIEKKIDELQKQPKGKHKTETLGVYSELAWVSFDTSRMLVETESNILAIPMTVQALSVSSRMSRSSCRA